MTGSSQGVRGLNGKVRTKDLRITLQKEIGVKSSV